MMKQRQSQLTDPSLNRANTVLRGGAIGCRFLKVMLALFSAAFIASQLPLATANEQTSGDQYESDDPRLLRLVARCLDCHAIDDDPAEHVGPSLQGIVGRRVADIDSYGYSAALYQKRAAGHIWDGDTLDWFLESPQSMAPGVAMIYSGVPDPDDRARLIAWLASGPKPLAAIALKSAALERTPEVSAVLEIQPDAEYGEYLAGGCLTCHFAPGSSGSVPPINGLPAAYFINALLEYQQGERANPIMQTMSSPLGAQELAALASVFAKSAP